MEIINREIKNTMTAGDIRALLAEYEEDTLVVFTSDYGDYTHTEQVHLIENDPEIIKIKESGYSNSGIEVDDNDNDDGDDEEPETTQKIIAFRC